MLLRIIIIVIILAILGGIMEFIKEHKDGLLIGVGILFLGCLGYSWNGFVGILSVMGICIVGAIGFAIFALLIDAIKEHGENMKKTAEINQKTEFSREAHLHETDLQNELDRNCRWLGYMDDALWRIKLPNYASRSYASSFEQITDNFAIQMEKQNITSNDDWFEPYIDYIVMHPEGTTIQKLIHEVNCPQLKMTHHSTDLALVETQIQKGSQRLSADIPPSFVQAQTGMNGIVLIQPSSYLLKKYSGTRSVDSSEHCQEFNFDDL